jgi:hypothetical protein
MAQNFVPLLDSLLGVVLIGAGVAVHLRKRLLIREPRRRFLLRQRTLYRLTAVVLVGVGIGLLLEAWLIADEVSQTQTAAQNSSFVPPVATSPAAPGEPAAEPLPVTHKTLLLVWGTPADDDSVGEAEATAYARALGSSAAASLPRRIPGLGATAKPISGDEWKSLLQDAEQVRSRCEAEDVHSVAAVSVGALRLEGAIGYATWREPEYLLVDCRTGETRRRRGHVNERIGDRVPYEQDVSDELRELVTGVSAAR